MEGWRGGEVSGGGDLDLISSNAGAERQEENVFLSAQLFAPVVSSDEEINPLSSQPPPTPLR